jgi:hypothetical protein
MHVVFSVFVALAVVLFIAVLASRILAGLVNGVMLKLQGGYGGGLGRQRPSTAAAISIMATPLAILCY